MPFEKLTAMVLFSVKPEFGKFSLNVQPVPSITATPFMVSKSTLTAGVSGLGWLSFGQTFGVQNPIVLDLGVMVITFGLTIKITIASIIGIILAAIIYHFI